MKQHPFRIRLPHRLVSSVQFRFAVTFTILVAILLALMNTYPTRASRDIVFTEKQSALTNRAAVVSSSLSLLDNLTPDNTRQVLALLDLRDLTRIIVTDSEGLAVYDSANESNIRGKYVLYPELVRALGGQAVFYSHYTTEAFLSRAAMPVMSSGRTVGAVYVCESDSERAALIGSIQRRLGTITIGIGAAALVVLWFSIKMLTRRITQLADGVRTVQSGDYSFRLTLSGHDELTELGQEFNNLEAQRRRFVSDASHELKTPLASIRLLSDSISQSADMDSATMREFVADIGSEAERLQRTTEKLLDLSRRDDGVQPDVTIVDLQQAVHGTLHLLRPLADQSGVTITCLMSEGVTVRASEDDIYHIVFNLVENAIKYNLPGGDVTVRVETHGGQSVLSVADTGIGIPEADRPNIFNRFYRVDKARSREHGGSGLGLSIVHDAGALYGGYLMYIVPASFNLAKSCELITTTVIGGLGSLTGSVLGAIIVTILPEIFRAMSNYRMLIYSIAVVLIIMFKPSGLYGYKEFSFKRMCKTLKRWGIAIGKFFAKLFSGKKQPKTAKAGKEEKSK